MRIWTIFRLESWSIRIADDSAQAATMNVGAIDVATYDPGKGTRNVIHDHRDPKIIDPMLNVAKFSNDSGETIASLLNFGNHQRFSTRQRFG